MTSHALNKLRQIQQGLDEPVSVVVVQLQPKIQEFSGVSGGL